MGELKKVIACLKALKIEPKLDSFESKLIVQKTVYLLDAMGLKTGYGFNFYIRGTYSPELTEEMYQNKQQIENLANAESLTEKELELVNEFREEMGKLDPNVLEVAAAYAYFVKECGLSAHEATIKTKEAKPYFSEMKFVQGINRAKALIFKPSAEDLKKLREITSPWDAASDEDLVNFEKKHLGKGK